MTCGRAARRLAASRGRGTDPNPGRVVRACRSIRCWRICAEPRDAGGHARRARDRPRGRSLAHSPRTTSIWSTAGAVASANRLCVTFVGDPAASRSPVLCRASSWSVNGDPSSRSGRQRDDRRPRCGDDPFMVLDTRSRARARAAPSRSNIVHHGAATREVVSRDDRGHGRSTRYSTMLPSGAIQSWSSWPRNACPSALAMHQSGQAHRARYIDVAACTRRSRGRL